MFAEIWPVIQSNISDRDQRISFTSNLLKLLVENDMDPYLIEDIHPDVRAAMRAADIAISEPDRYTDDFSVDSQSRKKWWQLR